MVYEVITGRKIAARLLSEKYIFFVFLIFRHDPANPGSYVVQRYISNPYLLGGKKFDLRLYVLVTSFRPLTVYIYRDGFAKFSSTRYR